MGNLLSSLFNYKKEKRVLMVGLDNAGKTTILYNLKLGEIRKTVPTIGFNVEQITYKKLNLTVWDIGGQDRIRPLWKHYFNGVNGVIFVIDINDTDREKEVLDELTLLVNDDNLRHIPILIYANKIDLPNRINIDNFTQQCYKIMVSNTFHIQLSCADKTEGLYEGLEWLNKDLMK